MIATPTAAVEAWFQDRPASPTSSRSSGVGKRGADAPESATHAVSRSASARSPPPLRDRRPRAASGHDSPVGPAGPAADDPAVDPDGRPGVAGRVEQGRPVGAEVPVARFPAHRRRVERRQEGDPGRRRRRRLDGRRGARGRAGRRRARTSTAPIAASAARVSRTVQPVHHARSASVAGPKRASQRRTSAACASATGTGSIGAPSHRSVVVQRYWLLTHVPRGRPRTIRPSTARVSSTRLAMLTSPSIRWPGLSSARAASIGTARESSAAVASPRRSSSVERRRLRRPRASPRRRARPAARPSPRCAGARAARRRSTPRPARSARPRPAPRTPSAASRASGRGSGPRRAPGPRPPSRGRQPAPRPPGRRTTNPWRGGRPRPAPPPRRSPPGRRARGGAERRVGRGALRSRCASRRTWCGADPGASVVTS